MEKLGIQPTQLLFQIINFGILFVLLTKFLYKPILKMLDERKKKIEQGLKDAEKAKKELEQGELKRQDIVKKAKDEAKGILEEAKKEGKTVEAEIVKKAHEEAGVIVEKARKDAQRENEELKKKLEDETVDLAAVMVEKILDGALSEKDQRAIIEKKLQMLEKSK